MNRVYRAITETTTNPSLETVQLIAEDVVDTFDLPFYTRLYRTAEKAALQCIRDTQCSPKRNIGEKVLIKILGVQSDISVQDLAEYIQIATPEKARLHSFEHNNNFFVDSEDGEPENAPEQEELPEQVAALNINQE